MKFYQMLHFRFHAFLFAMKTQLYTNIILTLIAVLLSVIALEGRNTPKAVRLVSIVKPTQEELAKAKEEEREIWSPVKVSGDVEVSGNVEVSNTVDVNVDNEPLDVREI